MHVSSQKSLMVISVQRHVRVVYYLFIMTQRLHSESTLQTQHRCCIWKYFFVCSCVERHDLCSWSSVSSGSSGSASTTFCFNFSPSRSIDSWQNIMISDGVWRRMHGKMWYAAFDGLHVSLWWSNGHINHSMNRLFQHMRKNSTQHSFRVFCRWSVSVFHH